MADASYGDTCVADKTPHIFKLPSSPDDGCPPHLTTVEDSYVSPVDHVALFAVLDDQGGSASLLGCLATLPGNRGSVSAMVALVEADMLEFDRGAPFEAHCRVTRVSR